MATRKSGTIINPQFGKLRSMPKKCNTMKKGRKSDTVHINDLPKDIIQKILVKLSIQEAVKTSVLSRNWRYAWTKLHELVFDDNFCDKSILKTKSTLISAIYQVLLLHHGPLSNFTLNLSNLDGSCPAIDQFLLVALKKGVKDLMIGIKEGEPYSLPSSIFEYGQQLEDLELISCVFKPPFRFNGFSKLEKLVIENADICGKRLSSLIYDCPLLKWLDFVSSTSTGCIDIDAPNLEYLAFESQGMSICFKNTPRLAQVELYSCQTENTEVLIEILDSGRLFLFGRLPVVEELTLDSFYLQCYDHLMLPTSPKLIVNDISRMKTLYLWNIGFGVRDDIVSALCLIGNIPNLEKLSIDVSDEETARDVEFIEVEDFSEVTLGCLKEVELLDVSGLKSELQFFEFILANSPILEKFLVKMQSDLSCKKKLKFCQELIRFRRASPLAEIAFKD